jgi:Ca-activated chloride channel family protein
MRSLLIILLGILPFLATAQGKLELYRGHQAYLDGDLQEAENQYRSSLNEAPGQFEGTFNLGNTYYRKQDLSNANSHYQQAIESESDPIKKARAYHNMGNSLLQNSKIDESIEAYKNALRLNPSDDETRYNLAYAQRMKRKQEQQEQQQQQQENQSEENQEENEEQNKSENQNESEDNQDQEGEDQQNKNQDESEGDEKEDQKPEPKDGEQDEEGKEQKKPRPIELSPREAEQLLEAAKNEDKQTLMGLRKQKGSDRKIEKDW